MLVVANRTGHHSSEFAVVRAPNEPGTVSTGLSAADGSSPEHASLVPVSWDEGLMYVMRDPLEPPLAKRTRVSLERSEKEAQRLRKKRNNRPPPPLRDGVTRKRTAQAKPAEPDTSHPTETTLRERNLPPIGLLFEEPGLAPQSKDNHSGDLPSGVSLRHLQPKYCVDTHPRRAGTTASWWRGRDSAVCRTPLLMAS